MEEKPSYMKGVDCTAQVCSHWREGNFCLFPGKLRIGKMGTCLSMSPVENFGKLEDNSS